MIFMTQRNASRLLSVQMTKSTDKALELLNKRGLRASPTLIRKVISEQSAYNTLNAITNNVVLTVKKNRALLRKVISDANAKANPHYASRQIAIFALNKLVKDGNKSALKGLLAALNEPDFHLRLLVVNMLSTFAKKDKRAFFGLKQATNDNESNIRLTALRGLIHFAKKKDARVFEIALKSVPVSFIDEREAALVLINTLAAKKYKPAMEFLEKYKGFKRELGVKSKLTGEF